MIPLLFGQCVCTCTLDKRIPNMNMLYVYAVRYTSHVMDTSLLQTAFLDIIDSNEHRGVVVEQADLGDNRKPYMWKDFGGCWLENVFATVLTCQPKLYMIKNTI
jgi:hypothetical protein